MRGIVFDLDGVLFDSTVAHAQAYGEALARFGNINLRYERIAGMRTDEAIRFVLQDAGISATEELVAVLTKEKRSRAGVLLRERKPLISGCVEAVRRLALRWPLALATSASPDTVSIFFAISGLESCFRAVVCGSDVKRGKPAPDLVTLAGERLGLGAAEIVLVEDAATGVTAGRAAGVRVLAVTGTEDPRVLRGAGAEEVVTGLGAVVATLESWARGSAPGGNS